MNKKFIILIIIVLLAISSYFALSAVRHDGQDPQDKVDTLLEIQR